jgi:uncharacterized protein YuzE
MKIEYDRRADAMYIRLRAGTVVESVEGDILGPAITTLCGS